MKKIFTFIFLLFITTTLTANKNWIALEHPDATPSKKPETKTDSNVSQMEPLNKMIKNAAVVKQLLDATSKKEKPKDEKNWFLLDGEIKK